MKPVLARIMEKKREYGQLPLFEFMRNYDINARHRLSFFPCMAFFILAFGDLNKYVLRSEPAVDEHQKKVNKHTYEDDHHWPWYLEDLTKLGFDKTEPWSNLLQFLWSDETKVQRTLMYRLTGAIANASTVEKLILVESIEQTGQVLFFLTTNLAEEVEVQLGTELRYCGHFHFGVESGHGMGYEHRALASIELTEEQRAKCLQHVDNVFAWFQEWTDELLAYAKAHPFP